MGITEVIKLYKQLEHCATACLSVSLFCQLISYLGSAYLQRHRTGIGTLRYLAIQLD